MGLEDWSGYSWWGRGASILRTVRFYLGNTDAGELWTCGGTEREKVKHKPGGTVGH